MALEHPGGEASDSQNVSRYVKLQEMYGKFLQEALQAPNHQVGVHPCLQQTQTINARNAGAMTLGWQSQRMQLIFEGLHPAIVTGISQLLREVRTSSGDHFARISLRPGYPGLLHVSM